MKICLVLQRRFAYLGHELAVLLAQKHGVAEFCGYVHERESYRYLQTQKDLTYSGLILDEDIQKKYQREELDLSFLASLEKECGNLWTFINVDRVIRFGQLVREYPHDTSPYTYEEMLRIIQVYGKALSAFLNTERPEVIIAYQPGSLGTLLLCALAKSRGIRILYIVPPVTRNRICVSERYDRLTGVEEGIRQSMEKPPSEIPGFQDAGKFLDEFRKRPAPYSTVYSYLVRHGKWKQLDFLLPQKLVRTIGYAVKMSFAFVRDGEKREDYTTIHPWWYILDHVSRKLRNMFGVDDLYDAYEPMASFAFFPLHFEPELSILLLAPFDTDQLAIIRRVARSLPVGMLLYVKEHPQMTPFRPRSFYREVKKIPNVRLLRPEIPSFEIVRNSSLVTVITGSAGWEATLLGKPVITFGEVFYNALSSVARSVIPQELPDLVRQQIVRGGVAEEELQRFLSALFEDSAQCDLLYLWELEKDREKKRAGLAEFAQLIYRKVHEDLSSAPRS